STLSGIGKTTVTVTDAGLTDTSSAPSTQPSVAEGASTGSLTLATFTDANPGDNHANFTATIHWGDGASDSGVAVSYSNGTYSVAGSHTYADEHSAYAVTVGVADDGGSTLSGIGKTTVTVTDAALTGSTTATAAGTEGATNSSVLAGATFTDAKPGDNSAEMTAV